MKTIIFSLICILVTACCISKKNENNILNKNCHMILEKVREYVTVDSLGKLYSKKLNLDDLFIKNRDCFIGKNKNDIVGLLGYPIKSIEENNKIQPASISYTSSQGCLNKKRCKQIFFIFDKNEMVGDIKVLVIN